MSISDILPFISSDFRNDVAGVFCVKSFNELFSFKPMDSVLVEKLEDHINLKSSTLIY